LGHDDFKKLVLNQWEWARVFAANTERYLG